MSYRVFARTPLLALCAILSASCTPTAAERPVSVPSSSTPPLTGYADPDPRVADGSVMIPRPSDSLVAPGTPVPKQSVDGVPTRSSASEAPSGPVDPVTAERRSVEALDRIAGFIPVKQDQRGSVVTLSTDDLFAPGEWQFAPTTALRLDDLATALRFQGDKQIEIDGFTDSLGTAQENEYLSLKRAAAVRDFLAAHHVDASKMTVQGLGARRPIAENSDSFGRKENRRIEIVILRSRRRPLGEKTSQLGDLHR